MYLASSVTGIVCAYCPPLSPFRLSFACAVGTCLVILSSRVSSVPYYTWLAELHGFDRSSSSFLFLPVWFPWSLPCVGPAHLFVSHRIIRSSVSPPSQCVTYLSTQLNPLVFDVLNTETKHAQGCRQPWLEHGGGGGGSQGHPRLRQAHDAAHPLGRGRLRRRRLRFRQVRALRPPPKTPNTNIHQGIIVRQHSWCIKCRFPGDKSDQQQLFPTLCVNLLSRLID